MTKARLREGGAILPLLLCAYMASAEAQELGTPFKDCAQCPQMVVMPGGSFLMGTPKVAQNASRASEGPQHQVTLKPFALGKFEVTQAQWTAVMGDDPSSNKGAGLPVEGVSWNAAKAFVEKLSEKPERRTVCRRRPSGNEQFVGIDSKYPLQARSVAFSPAQRFLYVGGTPGTYILNRRTLEVLGTAQIGSGNQDHPIGHNIGVDRAGNLYLLQVETTGLDGKTPNSFGAVRLAFKGYSPVTACCQGGGVHAPQ